MNVVVFAPDCATIWLAAPPSTFVALVAKVAVVAKVAKVASVAVPAFVAYPAFVAEPADVAYVAFVAEPAAIVDCATQDGAVAPAFTTMTWPAVPKLKNVVVSAAVL
jgi:hypothetical protein